MKKSSPLISIIIPAYNVESYIGSCLDSIINQNVQDIEIICVEDGSTDHTRSVLEAYAQKNGRIKIVVHNTNHGLSAARNTGTDIATGKFILYVDGDDYLVEGALQRMLSVLQENNLDLLFFGYNVFQVNSDSEIIYLPVKTPEICIDQVMTGAELLNLQVQHREYNTVVWAMFARADFLQQTGVHFFEGIQHEDELYTPLIMQKAGRAMCVADKLVMYRKHSSSIMGKGVSYKTVVGYFVGYCELMSAYMAGDCQVWGLRVRAEALYNSACAKFLKFSDEEQKLVIENLPEQYRFMFRKSIMNEKQLVEMKLLLKEKNTIIDKQNGSLRSHEKSLTELRTKLKKNNETIGSLQCRYSALQNSVSFKIGRWITFIPRRIRGWLRKI